MRQEEERESVREAEWRKEGEYDCVKRKEERKCVCEKRKKKQASEGSPVTHSGPQLPDHHHPHRR